MSICFLLLLFVALPAHSQTAVRLTLDDAVRRAEEANPALLGARAAIHAAEGQLAESRAPLWNNPEVAVDLTRKRIPAAPEPGNRAQEWRAGISQAFETGGQQGLRRQAAEAERIALADGIAEARAALRAEVEQRFVQVLALQRRAELERQTVALVDQAATLMEKRLQAGEANRIDTNLTRVEAARAANQLTQLDEQLTQARAELSALLQLSPDEQPEAIGDLRRDASYTLDDLLRAAERRSQLEFFARREEAARHKLELERASRSPDLTLGVFGGREGPSDLRENVLGLSLSAPLPLFRRNEAGIGRAMTELTQIQVERQAAERDARAGVRAQWQRVAQLEGRAKRLRQAVLKVLEDNQRLSQTALREGEIGVAELLLVNRQVAEVRRELLEAEADLRLARVALEKAAGWPPLEKKETK
jgi:cobalt-zinc-cadmium efflux system outer membrane protein